MLSSVPEESGMRAILAAVLATILMTSTACAAGGTLAPGKPAGTQQAQIETGGVMVVVGIAALAAVIAVVASTTQGDSTPNTNPSTGT
jgi:hypothetical protein